MNISVNAESVCIETAGIAKVEVTLQGVDIDDVVDNFSIRQIVDCIGKDELLGCIGEDYIKEWIEENS